jgi:hypothetical protein
MASVRPERALRSLHDEVAPTICTFCRSSGFVQVGLRTVTCEFCDTYQLWLSDEWCGRYLGTTVEIR